MPFIFKIVVVTGQHTHMRFTTNSLIQSRNRNYIPISLLNANEITQSGSTLSINYIKKCGTNFKITHSQVSMDNQLIDSWESNYNINTANFTVLININSC